MSRDIYTSLTAAVLAECGDIRLKFIYERLSPIIQSLSNARLRVLAESDEKFACDTRMMLKC